MMVKNSKKNTLTKKEQATTVAYKLKCEEIENLKASLKKTQDEAGRIRAEKHEIEKKKVILEERLSRDWLIRFFELLASAGLGFALNYIPQGRWLFAGVVGVPSLIVCLVCLYVTRK